jgi:putative integral membrane protein (TIGR02587 family)
MGAARITEESYSRGLGRAVAGAVIFSLPLLMTMEMWDLGQHMGRLRLALFITLTALVVFGLSRFAGFRDDTTFADDILDALAALMVGFVVSAALLWIMGLIGPQTGLHELSGMIGVQAAPASMGAILANKQLSASTRGAQKEDRAGYPGQLFLMGAGALFFAFNVAPTEEMLLIGFKMTPWQSLGLVGVSLLMLHTLVFSVGFAGQQTPGGVFADFLNFTLAGYGIALIVSLYVLWTFGRIDDDFSATIRSVAVVGFPAALGAALARLVV